MKIFSANRQRINYLALPGIGMQRSNDSSFNSTKYGQYLDASVHYQTPSQDLRVVALNRFPAPLTPYPLFSNHLAHLSFDFDAKMPIVNFTFKLSLLSTDWPLDVQYANMPQPALDDPQVQVVINLAIEEGHEIDGQRYKTNFLVEFPSDFRKYYGERVEFITGNLGDGFLYAGGYARFDLYTTGPRKRIPVIAREKNNWWATITLSAEHGLQCGTPLPPDSSEAPFDIQNVSTDRSYIPSWYPWYLCYPLDSARITYPAHEGLQNESLTPCGGIVIF